MKATLSLQLASLMIGARNLSDDVRKAVCKQVFDKVKADFAIPADHKLRVEIDSAVDPLFLTLVRKKDGSTYDLRPTDGKWVGSPEAAPAAPVVPADPRKWFKVDNLHAAVALHMQQNHASSDAEIQIDQNDVADLDAAGSDFIIKGDVAYIKLNPHTDF